MSDSLSPTEIQVLYEISLGIKPASDMKTTARTALSKYLQKLNCSAAAVFEARNDQKQVGYDLVTTVPDASAFERIAGDIESLLPDYPNSTPDAFPIVSEGRDVNRYLMELPEFGVIVLCKRGLSISNGVLRAISELNSKLATACNRVRIQKDYETQYNELFENAPVMFASTRAEDGKLHIEDCNRQFIETLGYERETVLGNPISSLYADYNGDTVDYQKYERALTSEPETTERVIETRDGRKITTILTAAPRRDRSGNAFGTHLLFINVTELKLRNQQLTVLNRILRHNLRNDLTVIKGTLDLIAEDANERIFPHIANAKRRTESLQSIAEGAQSVREILEIRDYSNEDLASILESLVSRAESNFPEATIELSTQPARIYAVEAIKYGFWELLENACMHAGEEPTVQVRIQTDQQAVVVEIIDDGPGLPEDEVQSLVDGKETQLNHSSGLGLWLAKWVIELSGGELTFNSNDGAVVRAQFYRIDH